MFVSTLTVGGHRYARILESVRVNGKPRHRVVANLGNVATFAAHVPAILRGLHKLLGEELPEDDVTLESVSTAERGVTLAVDALFKDLGLDSTLRRCFRAGKGLCPAEMLVRAMVANRLSRPASKLGAVAWLKDVSMGPEEDVWLATRVEKPVALANRFYEAMDGLYLHRARIERALYARLRTLFSLKVDLVFYDLTSSYFEGSHADYGRLGYSRDERSGNEQIMIGLMLVDGLPIGHHVFRGNRSDKSCLKAAVEDAERRFKIGRIVLVGDRGLLSAENLKMLRGKKHEYILACRKRRDGDCRAALRSRPPLPEPPPAPADGSEPEPLAPVIWPQVAEDGDRLVGYTNLNEVPCDRERRDDILNCFREELDGLQDWCKKSDFASRDEKIAKLAELLTNRRRLGKRYFSGQITKDGRLEYLAKQRVLAYEKLLDGTTILKTNNRTLSDADVVARYKELAKIERAFRDLKSLIDLRPIYHRTARRVSAHVFLCVLALLLEGVLDRKLRQAKVEDLSAAAAFQEMRRLRLLRDKVNNVEVSRLSAPSALQKQILAALGIKEPAALVGVKTLKKPKS